MLDQKAEVGDQHEAALFQLAWVLGVLLGLRLVVALRLRIRLGLRRVRIDHDRLRLRRIGLRVVALHLQQEQAAFRLRFAVAVFGEVRRQVDGLVMRLAALQRGQRPLHLEAIGDVVWPETVDELGVREAALRLRDQVLQLRRLYPRDLHAQARQVAHQHRHLFLTAQRQQRALAQDAQLWRIRRHGDDVLRVRAHQVAAKALRLAVDLHVERAADIGTQLERVHLRLLLRRRHGAELEPGRELEHLPGDLARVRPCIGLVGLLLLLDAGVLQRQHPRDDVFGDLAFVH